ncbi:autotransporter outer membrane beta-barrel domain-containing protein [Paraburkholderia strydomiana]|uniref:autotransporter outer membrane beta-barrel domain-containing protein n=1 Tax=Paraburkholderia strydomiana TaxID=1245417 RepID=UPI001BED285C|nr:autotransporter outer membrane beta-barrel domain-containing protein [Paraburkholderia strydomiana]MBT2793332.1 autotransporter outer membrane beta-barrel domain-containing protein [Paraburkholderia strydomiana]
MNKLFKTIWNEALGAWVAACELDLGKGRRVASVSGSTHGAIAEDRHSKSIALLTSSLLVGLGAPLGHVCAQTTIDLTTTNPSVDIGSTTRTINGLTVADGVNGAISGAGGTLIYTGGPTFTLGSAAGGATQNLNMAGLSSFTFNDAAQPFNVGGRYGGSGTNSSNTTATLTLSPNSVITASAFNIATVGNPVSNGVRNVGTVNLGQSTTINADTVNVGAAGKTAGTLTLPAGGNVVLRGTDGTSPVANWNIGINNTSSLAGTIGSVNFNAGSLDAKVTNLLIGQSAAGNGKIGTASLALGSGTLDASSITVGSVVGSSTRNGESAALTIGSATVNTQTFTLGDNASSVAALSATVNLNNGGALLAQTIQNGAGSATRTFNWTNGTVGNRAAGQPLTLSLAGVTLAGSGPHVFDIEGSGASASVSSVLSGAGALTKQGAGTLALTAGNTYTGGTTIQDGTVLISSDGNLGGPTGGLTLDGGTLETSANITSPRNVTLASTGTFLTDAGTALTLAGPLSGSGSMTKTGSGSLLLTGTNTYSGPTTVANGSLIVNGDQSAAAGLTTVQSSGTIGGTGTIGGSVVVANGGAISPGDPGAMPGTLTVRGDLTLNSGSALNYNLGQANVPGGALNDLTSVGGNLTLDGTLNVATTAGGAFSPGIYRIINYSGTLTNNGLAVGTVPSPSYFVQTSVAKQINLVNTAGLALSYWDGAGSSVTKNDGVIQGGSGSWTSATTTDNWTTADGSVNAPYAQGSFAIFTGTPGLVTPNGVPQAAGMQFAVDGYRLFGGAVQLVGGASSIIRVGDGTTAGAGYTATLSTALSGSTQLVKTDLGTLVLTAINNYSGGTDIQGGTLSISRDVNLGASTGGLTLDGGTLKTTATMTSARTVTVASTGTFNTDAGTTLTLSGPVSGAGSLTKSGAGTLTLASDATYSGGTTVSAGTLQLGNGGSSGSITGDVANGGTLSFNRSDAYTFSGAISGSGTVSQAGSGATVLTGNNTYTGGTTISAGTLQLGNGGTAGSITGNVANNGTLAFNRSDATTFANVVSGTGTLEQIGTGTTVLSGTNSYAGATNVAGGSLIVNGNQSAATGLTTVQSGATIGGTGTIGGSVVVATGGSLNPGNPGATPGTLRVNGSLTLDSGSVLNYNLGQANIAGGAFNDLTEVGGDLALAGALNVQTTPGATFSPGVYRVINYTGVLTNNGLSVGTIPSPDFYVQTSVANQVNLVNTAGLTLRFWDGAAGARNDGAIQGGDGVWQNSLGNDSWTNKDGTPNAPFTDRAFAVFQGVPGNVTVDNSLGQVRTSGMQFAVNGYHLNGGSIELAGPTQSTIRVGDGTQDGARYTVTIDNALGGNSQLVKTDLGTLVLNGNNTYTGGTEIQGGTVRISSDASLGASSGGLRLDGGTLHTTASMTSARNVSLASTGTLLTDAGTTLTLSGPVDGPGSMTKEGSGTLVLRGESTHTGGTTISAGTLRIGDGGTTGSLGGNVTNNATLAFDRSDTYTSGGTISGTGAVSQIGSGTTVLTGSNSYSGGTSIGRGTLSVSSDANLGATSGAVTLDGGTLRTTSDMASARNLSLASTGTVLTDAGTTLTLNGTTTGTGSLRKAGSGTLLLAGANTQSGDTIVSGGTLETAAANVLSAASAMTVQSGGTLNLDGFNQTIPTLTNAGTVALNGAPGTTLSVSGNYTGAGGLLRLNTVLNQGGTTSSDMLAIGGDASGDTRVQINGSGSGAQTGGDGIRVVQVAGASTATAFRLAAPVQAGAYEYLLYRGGSTGANDWFLRSQLEAQGVASPPAVAVAAYRPATTGYALTPSLNLDYGFSVLGTLHERVGDIAALEGKQPGHAQGIWGRIGGQDVSLGGNERFSFDTRTFFAQFGKDWTLSQRNEGGSTHAGVTVSFGTSSASFDDSARAVNPTLRTGTGTLTAQSQSLGAYWTRYFADHAYVDAVTQLTHYRNKYGDVYGGSATQNGFGVAGSLEVGKPWSLGSTAISIEPQAQLAWQYQHLNGFTDDISPVSGSTSNALRGRLGFRLFSANLQSASSTSTATPYLTADVLHDFFSPGASTVGGTTFAMDPAKTWYQLGGGVTAGLGKTSELYLNVGYARNLGGEYRRTVYGQAGYRYSW